MAKPRSEAFSSIILALLVLSLPYYLIGCRLSENMNTLPDTDPTDPPISRVADHTIVGHLWQGTIPEEDILHARNILHIGYGHTSHGAQITYGMTDLVSFANAGNLGTAYSQDLFAYSQEGSATTLHLFQGAQYGTGELELDLRDYPGWVDETRAFLDNPDHSEYNVIMWSWCYHVAEKTEQTMIDTYLDPMNQLEADYPQVVFVYMTGHLNGTGVTGNLHLRNEQIRQFCSDHDKWLYDFADIESYSPSGTVSFVPLLANDACDYDSNGSGGLDVNDSNWAQEWQNSHTAEEDWYSCTYSPHTEPLNTNMKAYAAWWLFVQIADSMDD